MDDGCRFIYKKTKHISIKIVLCNILFYNIETFKLFLQIVSLLYCGYIKLLYIILLFNNINNLFCLNIILCIFDMIHFSFLFNNILCTMYLYAILCIIYNILL